MPEISHNKHIYRPVALATSASRSGQQLEHMGGREEIRFLGDDIESMDYVIQKVSELFI